MWRLFVLCVCGLLIAIPAAAQSVKSDQQTLMDLERRWNMAFHSGDVKFIESILDDEFIATYDDGVRADKKTELAHAESFNQQIDASALDDFTIRIYGDTAIVWFTLHLLGPMQGKPVELTFRYTDVWVLRDGEWKCVSSHSTRFTPKPASTTP
jgi:ketosteroid isomerase-like protein